MSDNRFVYAPSTVDIKRSKFQMNSFWKGSIYHGDLVPLEITEILPGDSAKYDLACFIRTATPPIYPIMDTIRLSIAAFFVPKRLVWSKTKEFYGENTEGYGIQSEVLEPRTSVDGSVPVNYAATTYARSIGTYLGLVRQKTTSLTKASAISLNPIRSFFQVYNDWFKNENFMPPYLWDHSQTGDGARAFATLSGSNLNAYSDVPVVCKQLDRFTSCLPWAQKGDPVLIGTAGLAPVITGDVNSDLASKITGIQTYGLKSGVKPAMYGFDPGFGIDSDVDKLLGVRNEVSGHYGELYGAQVDGQSDINYAAPINLYADLSKATAASINQFRLAFATQRYLEALARTGSKYREYIKGIFGVSIGDTTAQMAEYLGGMTIELNVDQVLQTTGFSAGSSTTLGAPGASSTSAASDYLFTKSFTEPGFLVVVAYTKHNRTYGQGIDEIFQRHELLEYYNPKFANIGEQAIKSNNLYFSGEDADDNDRFGFQEAWSEYRYKKDVVIGALNPANSSSFNFTNLADKYDSKPVLNADFLKEDRTNIARCLAGGTASPDYFLDIKFKRTFVRPMPLYSIPGLIDHH